MDGGTSLAHDRSPQDLDSSPSQRQPVTAISARVTRPGEISLDIARDYLDEDRAVIKFEVAGAPVGERKTRALQGEEVTRTALPAPWGDWALVEACATSAGVCALFDDGASGQLAMLEPRSLHLVTHYLQDRPVSSRDHLWSVCADATGRGYVQKGTAVWLLGETGAPGTDWHHHRVHRGTD